MPEKKPTKSCFVIMPFSKTTDEHDESYWSGHFEFLKGLIEQHSELEAHRSEALRADIIKQIIADLITSDVVVADLTDHNPNVFWELGVRQSFKSGTITIAQEGTSLPFDIDKKGTLFYCPGNHIKNGAFTRNFNKAIKDCLDNPEKCDSPVLESITGRGTVFGMFQRDETLRRLDAVLSECDSNTRLYKRYVDKANNNPKARREKSSYSFPSELLRSQAIELLIAHRYIKETSKFYETAEKLHDDITAMKAMTVTWQDQGDYVEKWILKNEEGFSKDLSKFKKLISEIRERILNNV